MSIRFGATCSVTTAARAGDRKLVTAAGTPAGTTPPGVKSPTIFGNAYPTAVYNALPEAEAARNPAERSHAERAFDFPASIGQRPVAEASMRPPRTVRPIRIRRKTRPSRLVTPRSSLGLL